MKRPMFYWAVLFVLGEVLYKLRLMGNIGVYVIPMVIFMYITVVIFRSKNSMLMWIGVAFLAGGVFCFRYQEKQRMFLEGYCGREVLAEGTVIRREEKQQGVAYVVRTKKIDGKSFYTKILLYGSEELEEGMRLTVRGTGESFSGATNPGQYDERSSRNGQGIFLKLEQAVVLDKCRERIGIRRNLALMHDRLKAVYEELFDEGHASLACAMVLGDKSLADKDLKQLYQRNGIAHLIAISGLHIAMIGGTLYKLLRRLIGNYSIAAGTGVVFILAYGVMTGLSGSTARAMIMLVTQIGADVFGRKYDSVTAISLALWIMLLINPGQITQAGFLLSFGAVIGIAVVNPVWKEWFPKMPSAMKGLWVSISVQLTILPVLLYYFYEVPVYGVLLNLIVVPLMGVLLACLLLCGISGVFHPGFAELFQFPAVGVFQGYEMLCKAAEKLPFHTVCSGRPSVFWCVLYYVLLAVFVKAAAYQKKHPRFWLLAIGIGVAVLFSVFRMPGKLQICMFDVGQGDGIYIRTPSHTHILVDGGSSSKQKIGTYVLKNGVKYYGGDSLDYVILSHLDKDHYSGVSELLESGEIMIKNLVLPCIANPDEAYRQMEKLAGQRGCNLIYMKRGDYIRIGEVGISCMHPKNREYIDKNEGSLVFLLSFRKFDMLFTGDMTNQVEQMLMQDFPKKVEVLKVSHHGSETASGESFVEALSPEVALLSVGAGNRYGHPAPSVMETLTKYCNKIYLTKDSGAITIDSDGFCFRIREFLENGGR